MKVLGISTATKIVSFGLIDDDKVLAEASVASIHSEKILLYVKEAGVTPEQIEGVAVAGGPGSYSGLRGGLATAKSLAQTLNIPLVGISTLEAIAYNIIDAYGTIAVILPARRDENNFALFSASDGKLKRLTSDMVLNSDKIKEKLDQVQGELYKITDKHPTGTSVAQLGLIRLKNGETENPLTLTPSYSYQPNIREF